MGSTEAMRPGPQRPALASQQLIILSLVAGFVLIVGGALTIWAAGRRPATVPAPQAPAVSTASRPLTDELLETTRALRATQQETVDQLQIMQDQLAAQKLESKRLNDQISAINERLETLHNSLPAASSASAVLPKSHR